MCQNWDLVVTIVIYSYRIYKFCGEYTVMCNWKKKNSEIRNIGKLMKIGTNEDQMQVLLYLIF